MNGITDRDRTETDETIAAQILRSGPLLTSIAGLVQPGPGKRSHVLTVVVAEPGSRPSVVRAVTASLAWRRWRRLIILGALLAGAAGGWAAGAGPGAMAGTLIAGIYLRIYALRLSRNVTATGDSDVLMFDVTLPELPRRDTWLPLHVRMAALGAMPANLVGVDPTNPDATDAARVVAIAARIETANVAGHDQWAADMWAYLWDTLAVTDQAGGDDRP